MGMPALRRGKDAAAETEAVEEGGMSMNKPRVTNFQPGDEISYAMPSGMLYGTVSRIIGTGEDAAVEIEFEDGRKEIKKVRDRSLSLLKRATGKSEAEEAQGDRQRLRDPDVERIRRSEQRKRWH
jgi:hypothetical protein